MNARGNIMQNKFGELWKEYEGKVQHVEIYNVSTNGPKGIRFTLEILEGSMRGEQVEVEVFNEHDYY